MYILVVRRVGLLVGDWGSLTVRIKLPTFTIFVSIKKDNVMVWHVRKEESYVLDYNRCHHFIMDPRFGF